MSDSRSTAVPGYREKGGWDSPQPPKGALRFCAMFPGRIKDNKKPLSGRPGLLEM